jgi:hypothetical protein
MSVNMTPRDAAKEILWNRNEGITWKAAQFLGQVVGLPDRPLSEAQLNWLAKLMAEAGLTQGADA